MRQVAGMVERHREGILGHWQQELIGPLMEVLNRLF
jgi:hypothetical protein